MTKTGAILLLVGGGGVVAYVFYLVFQGLYTSPDVHLVFKIGLPVALVGVALLLASVVRDRLKAKGEERFEEVLH